MPMMIVEVMGNECNNLWERSKSVSKIMKQSQGGFQNEVARPLNIPTSMFYKYIMLQVKFQSLCWGRRNLTYRVQHSQQGLHNEVGKRNVTNH